MKSKLIYKLIVAVTFIVPISSFMLIQALNGQTYDYEIFTQDDAVIELLAYDDNFIVFSDEASYNGYLVPYNESYALYIEEDNIVKVDKDYFTVFNGQWKNLNDIPPTEEKSSFITISIASVVALGIAGLIIGSKFDLLKSHPVASAVVSMTVITAIFMGIQSIIDDMTIVFQIVTAEVYLFAIETGIYNGILTSKQTEKAQADLLRLLKGAK